MLINKLLSYINNLFVFHYIINRLKRKKWYIIEGNIGSGKSELLTKINKHLDCEIILEPVDVWQKVIGSNKNILQYFYEDPLRYAYLFQTIVFKTRLQSIDTRQIKNLRFCERSIWTDKYVFGKSCINSSKMNEIEINAYKLWFDWLEKKFNKIPDGIIYLDCLPLKCMERIHTRNRNEETNIKLDYIQELDTYHKEWLYTWDKTKVLIIDNNIDNDWDNVIQSIKTFIQK